MPRQLPKPIEDLRKLYPAVWKAFNELGNYCHDAGPLDEKSRRLVKLALSIGAGLEGATHSAVRSAYKVGITQEEIDLVRQQWNFSPPGTVRETEDYTVELSDVTILELRIVPDQSGGETRASLASLHLA
jgi:hypothetical protein